MFFPTHMSPGKTNFNPFALVSTEAAGLFNGPSGSAGRGAFAGGFLCGLFRRPFPGGFLPPGLLLFLLLQYVVCNAEPPLQIGKRAEINAGIQNEKHIQYVIQSCALRPREAGAQE